MEPTPQFQIAESQMDGCLRLSLIGELDRWSVPALDERLTRARVMKSPVRLDLSRLQFIDSSGLHFLIRAIGDARITRWQLRIEQEVNAQVISLFKLVHLDSHLLGVRAVPGLAVNG